MSRIEKLMNFNLITNKLRTNTCYMTVFTVNKLREHVFFNYSCFSIRRRFNTMPRFCRNYKKWQKRELSNIKIKLNKVVCMFNFAQNARVVNFFLTALFRVFTVIAYTVYKITTRNENQRHEFVSFI